MHLIISSDNYIEWKEKMISRVSSAGSHLATFIKSSFFYKNVFIFKEGVLTLFSKLGHFKIYANKLDKFIASKLDKPKNY